jgi:hypothetical protein
MSRLSALYKRNKSSIYCQNKTNTYTLPKDKIHLLIETAMKIEKRLELQDIYFKSRNKTKAFISAKGFISQ